ncbi:PAS domain-containing protein [Endobacterium cereale]|uniref:PAS domain-containing protein n=1 Tax=Endobacterium cereale TaxID=2663029 RepID=UPI002B486166|nr:PAS domain-containing protein [Endobacterium cereale]MEB2848049.1 PAS domain-containing protein [Endobacterium cereale]
MASTISVQEIRALVDAMPGLGWAAWPNGNFICQSPSMEDYTAFPSSRFVEREAYTGKFAWNELLHNEDYPRLEKAWLEAVESGGTFDVAHRVLTGTGIFRWLRTAARAQTDPTGRIIFWLGTCLDIDDAVSEMKASQEREKALQNFIDAVPVPIWAADKNGDPLYFNQALRSQVGIDVSHDKNSATLTLDQALAKVIHPDDLQNVSSALKATFAGGEPFMKKYRQVRADGTFRWTKGETNALADEEGSLVRWLGVAQDIDDEVTAQAAIAEREARLALIIETMPGLLWVSSPDGQPTFFSRQLEQWSGLTVEQITRRDVDALTAIIQATIHPEHQEDVETSIRKSFKSGEPWFKRFRQRRFDGTWRWLEARMEPLRDDRGEILQWYGLQVDIENEFLAQESLRASQDKLARASRYAGMAELSASIAHELAQPLAAVIMGADACRRWLEMIPQNSERAKQSAESVVRDANIATEVVGRIRALFQHKSAGREKVDLNLLIQKTSELMREGLASTRIRVELELETQIGLVSIDPIQIQQVLVNLLHNAAEAMSGQLAVERVVTVRTFTAEAGIVVEISDKGCGITDIDRIFMPFFTTKESGMGIGLSICETIVVSHGGRIWAENTDPGARISFAIPTACRH